MSAPDTAPPVTDDQEEGRLLVIEGGVEAQLVYDVEPGRLLLLHTEVPEAFRGRGIGARLVEAAVAKAGREQLTIVPWCPYARRWLKEHPDALGSVTVDFHTPPPGLSDHEKGRADG